jgi:hypothetical protein
MIEDKEKYFLKKLEEEINIFNNFSVIMEKALKDGYITQLFNTIQNIFQKEIEFALKGKVKRTFSNENQKIE